ncbi:MAG: acyltransferase domain-containing protein [Coriobacteriales bacterium]|jgi:acyl transferase domain-containing protein|nr:acyltransferase domain-containing protein [Coriobacteriales bacterium]
MESSAWPSELFIFRGETPKAAQELMAKTRAVCAARNDEGKDSLKLRDLALSLLDAHKDTPVHFAIVADNLENLLASIDAALAGDENPNVYPRKPLEGKVVFLFPGQGSQRVNMAADLFTFFPKTRRLLNAHPEYEPVIFPAVATTREEKKEQRAAITDTRNAQPLLGMVDLAIAELLCDLGIKADMLAGHSFGELAALCFAGVLPADDLPSLSQQRAEAVLRAVDTDPGRMAAVRTDRETLTHLLKDESAVWAANFNAPTQTVIAGASAELKAFLTQLDAANISWSELNVACAFHSPLLTRAESLFAEVLQDKNLSEATLPVWSNTTASIYPSTPADIKKRLATHLVSPVRFVEEVEQMYAAGGRVFIETGPGSVLTGLVERILNGREALLIPTERATGNGLTYLLHALARYVSSGRELLFTRLFEGRD